MTGPYVFLDPARTMHQAATELFRARAEIERWEIPQRALNAAAEDAGHRIDRAEYAGGHAEAADYDEYHAARAAAEHAAGHARRDVVTGRTLHALALGTPDPKDSHARHPQGGPGAGGC